MNRVNGSIDAGLLPKKKSFVKYFLSWDCKSEFVHSKAGFKIIKVKNVFD